MLPEKMRDTVGRQGLDTWISQQNLQSGAGRWIIFFTISMVSRHHPIHFSFSYSESFGVSVNSFLGLWSL